MRKTAAGLEPWQAETGQSMTLLVEDTEGSTIELKLAVKTQFRDDG
jgi:hypothetical protein